MSQRLISLSPDLKRLQDEGYDIDIVGGYVVIRYVPYVDSNTSVQFGALVASLELAGDRTAKPKDHVVLFAGSFPCDATGKPIVQIQHQTKAQTLAPGLEVHHSFSNKPPNGFPDYYEKMTHYINVLLTHAAVLDPNVSAKQYRVVKASADDDSPFQYVDTASSRADILMASAKLRVSRVVIIGLGGTGSYILDLVSKTPVRQIDLYDGDYFLQHNAFRAPGAATIDVLAQRLSKVEYLARIYSALHKNIVPHHAYLDEGNIEELVGADFVFLSLDGGPDKALIVSWLIERGIPFIDTGMGLDLVDNKVFGLVRTTTVTAAHNRHVAEFNRIPDASTAIDTVYAKNIQVADLNALNAALAVIKWKKLAGFYNDLEQEHHSVYTVDGNHLANEDKP